MLWLSEVKLLVLMVLLREWIFQKSSVILLLRFEVLNHYV